jgi:hypothetical protein
VEGRETRGAPREDEEEQGERKLRTEGLREKKKPTILAAISNFGRIIARAIGASPRAIISKMGIKIIIRVRLILLCLNSDVPAGRGVGEGPLNGVRTRRRRTRSG